MTFLPITKDTDYDICLAEIKDNTQCFKALDNIQKHNPSIYNVLIRHIKAIEMATKSKLNDDDALLLMNIAKINFVIMYQMLDKEAERMALEKVNVKTKLN